MTVDAAARLTGAFGFHIPQRWSIAHLYQAILNGESHIRDIAFLTTLSGHIHFRLTGQKVIGLGEASGFFPVEKDTYHPRMMETFNSLISDYNLGWTLQDLFPRILPAGEQAGTLTEEGARLLDPDGLLEAGIPMCPPEGDAGTGMVSTNSVTGRSGSISAGTSVFAMIVLEKELSQAYPEIDVVATPAGRPVAMVHCNNCTSDLDAWAGLFREAHELFGGGISKEALYGALYRKALEGDPDCGGLLAYNYLAGEHLTGFEQGRPLFARLPDSRFSLANFMRTLLFSSMGTLRLGMDLLTGREHVRVDRLNAQGGLFKTKDAGQRLMAAALGVPVAVTASAGEGGAWGISLLAMYMARKRPGEPLEDFLAGIFAGYPGACIEPDGRDVAGFNAFMERYKQGLAIERAAVESFV
jgi:sugar (pentulose or hexulose) kinase